MTVPDIILSQRFLLHQEVKAALVLSPILAEDVVQKVIADLKMTTTLLSMPSETFSFIKNMAKVPFLDDNAYSH